ncbi:MAG: hypothetical protein K0U29_05970 [Gammaproteobacteria bacterium]|nr:hypothetical protein [Gammaproteobacteria bacterium]MCH9744460.1 hypothetical protein [Gammaproteobacteria bacterium]
MQHLSDKQQRTLIAAVYTAPYYFLAIAYFLYVTHSELSFNQMVAYHFESKFLCYQVGLLLIISWCTRPDTIMKSSLNRLMIGVYAFLATSLLLNISYYLQYMLQSSSSKKLMLHELLFYTGSNEMHYLYTNLDWLIVATLLSIGCGMICKYLFTKNTIYASKKIK